MDDSLLSKVAEKLRQPPAYAERTAGSILTLAAGSYGAHHGGEETQPTGFDPQAAALFEAVIEAAFIVANADEDFDPTEREAFKSVVLTACGGSIAEPQVVALMADLEDLLKEDGVDKRVEMVGRTIKNPQQAREVLRIAGLIAYVSAGVSDIEREVLEKLTHQFGLPMDALEEALNEVSAAVS